MSSSPLESISVLVIDDHSAMRKILRQLLGQLGIGSVHEADNGRTAFEWLCNPARPLPDLIICDLYMDKMDGMEFCNQVRLDKQVRKNQIPILLLTGERDPMVLEVVQQAGAATVLEKPISAPQLGEAIMNAIGFAPDLQSA